MNFFCAMQEWFSSKKVTATCISNFGAPCFTWVGLSDLTRKWNRQTFFLPSHSPVSTTTFNTPSELTKDDFLLLILAWPVGISVQIPKCNWNRSYWIVFDSIVFDKLPMVNSKIEKAAWMILVLWPNPAQNFILHRGPVT